ncbi:iron-containing redox enzyme family protein [Pseudonocardia nigra]|uniref:iron-containing redox enzyme family protein n=1 Tax=Pseudonocardia nigra TaxID=1921578 RepID=UPI001C5D3B9E|nr:iron-containing redox enzyme family protein [Pseudonocardia nigra]
MTVAYGSVAEPADLEPGRPPSARGPLTEWLFSVLDRPVHAVVRPRGAPGDPLTDEDAALALYALYELHYRGFEGVDEEWEWEPSLLAVRRDLEDAQLAGLRAAVGGDDGPNDVVAGLYAMADGAGGRSLSAFLAVEGTLEQMREFAVHRSAYQLKEADPHTWAIPRLVGSAKAAMVEVQADEYGEGRERDMHQNLFALTMKALGLDCRYGAYLDVLPAPTLAAVNVISFFGLHRRWRGALVGHLALFEMTSVEPMGRYSQALRRLGFGPGARHFFEVHVVADAHHERVAARDLAGGLAAQDPRLSGDILFGARSAMAAEGAVSDALLDAWQQGRTSLRAPLSTTATAGPPA